MRNQELLGFSQIFLEVNLAGDIGSLRLNNCIPRLRGVYFIVTKKTDVQPKFLSTGTGGYFKGKNPNVDLIELERNWVENANILYIGKANNLNQRLNQYFKFGSGHNVPHWGGRYIWQLECSEKLLVYCAICDSPRQIENQLLIDFKNAHHKLPFANLKT